MQPEREQPVTSSPIPPGVLMAGYLSLALPPASAPLLLGTASPPAGGVSAAGSPAPAVWALSSLGPLTGRSMLQLGPRPAAPALGSAVAPLVVPSIGGGGGCPPGSWAGDGGSYSGICWPGLFSSLLPALSPALSGSFFCSSFPPLSAVPFAAAALVDYWLPLPSP